MPKIYSWGKKDSTKRYLWSKIILTTSSVGASGIDPPPRKMNTFFLRSLTLSIVCQFIEISNQMEPTGEVLNIERFFLYKFFCSTFDTSPVDSI